MLLAAPEQFNSHRKMSACLMNIITNSNHVIKCRTSRRRSSLDASYPFFISLICQNFILFKSLFMRSSPIHILISEFLLDSLWSSMASWHEQLFVKLSREYQWVFKEHGLVQFTVFKVKITTICFWTKR